MRELPLYSGCFVCGQENRIGLKARFFWDGEKAVCDIVAEEAFAGYKNILHGGIVATLLDEIMIKALLAEDILAVTAEITIRLKNPVYTGDNLHLEGWKTDQAGNVFHTRGRAVNQSGEIVAEATAKYVKPKEELSGRLSRSRQ
ncbi:MAG: PaaI family thioesterase [FCB group bacterium]|nr:PaaI family thioesterase [FCB group bacterium]